MGYTKASDHPLTQNIPPFHPPSPTHEKCSPTSLHPKYTSIHLHPPQPTHKKCPATPPTRNIPPLIHKKCPPASTHPHPPMKNVPPPTHKKCPPTPIQPKYTSTHRHLPLPTNKKCPTTPHTQNIPPPTPIHPPQNVQQP